jgi:winged helix DNA-binding protein
VHRAIEVAAEVSWPEVHEFRLGRHHLLERAPKSQLAKVVGDIGGAQAQVMSNAELQIAVRADCTVADIRDALWKKKSLVKTWLMRGTLHLIPSKDLPIYTGAMGAHGLRNLNAWLKYLKLTEAELHGIFDGVAKALNGTPMTREELVAAVGNGKSEHVKTVMRSGWGGVLKPAARRGSLCFGPNRGQSVTFVSPQAWLPAGRDVDAKQALTEAAARYLRAYGPATRQDFARWWGAWPGVGAEAWKLLDGKLVTVSMEGQASQLLADDVKKLAKPTTRSVQLLPGFDPYLMGHANRDHLFDKVHRWKVSRVAGWISPVILVDGRVLGVWSHTLNKQKMKVELNPFAPLQSRVVKEAHARAESIAEALGAKLEKVATP